MTTILIFIKSTIYDLFLRVALSVMMQTYMVLIDWTILVVVSLPAKSSSIHAIPTSGKFVITFIITGKLYVKGRFCANNY
ncbi:hypothetical protein [Nostoc sp. FACHB-190]|uniref:hypothetical protein n=1 Tax=Nostoc sp. FACHB-190 TaxID=2692838 RepID=UPI001683FF80|nr:hypothetical protein [Nostoc sp. FACHB-190]